MGTSLTQGHRYFVKAILKSSLPVVDYGWVYVDRQVASVYAGGLRLLRFLSAPCELPRLHMVWSDPEGVFSVRNGVTVMSIEREVFSASTLEGLRDLYQGHLFGQILPFWLNRGIDAERGGYYTCFANAGGQLLHTHKFTWSQGRFVWVWARLASQFAERAESARFLQLARSGADFLMEHALLPNGNCSFILSREGKPILLDDRGHPREARPGEAYDSSTYADCFVIYGLSEYARVARDRPAFEFALGLSDSVEERLAAGEFRTDPYPTPCGYRQHGVPMILLETSRELALTSDGFDPARAAAIRGQTGNFAGQVLDGHRQADSEVVIEFLGADGQIRDTMLGTYINPGHTLESMWFVMHYAQEVGDRRMMEAAVATVRRACELGWDEEFGGLLQFVHMEGGRPRGNVPSEHEGSAMIHKLHADWDAKLWWVHSEALYALLLSCTYTREPWAEEWYRRIHDYTFETFPAEGKGEEWIAIRNRDGSPSDRVVALPVKDPFHVPRAFMHMIRLLDTHTPAQAQRNA